MDPHGVPSGVLGHDVWVLMFDVLVLWRDVLALVDDARLVLWVDLVLGGELVMVLYCDALVLVCMEQDFGGLVCNQLVSSCREQCALDDGLDEALDER